MYMSIMNLKFIIL